jgi:hypothetical protein
MKTVKYILVLIVLVLLANACSLTRRVTGSGQTVTHFSDSTRLTEGTIVYALPMTVFTIRIGMEREIEIPGPYAKYAGDLLGLQDVILSGKEKWTIRSIKVNSHEEADPSEFYVIDISGSLQTNVLALKKEGFILDINPETVYSSTGSFIEDEININQFRSSDLGSDEYYVTQTDTVYKRISMDKQFIRVPYSVEKKKKLTTEELAERASRRLMDLREGKILILTGEATVFPQSSAPLDEMNRLEKDYTELFTGKHLTEARTFQYHFIPGREHIGKPLTFLMFSESEGPVEQSSENIIPINIEINPEQKTKDLTIISRQQPETSEQKTDKLYYRIPDVVNLKIKMGEKTIYNSRKLVYQLGEVMQLPSNYIIGK